jgi:signal transduction histidine kinase
MIDYRAKRERRDKLLDRYGSQLGVIVDRYRAERALMAAKQDAETLAQVAQAAMLSANSANQAKSEFLANMSHELRTPLNAIIGFSDMIVNDLQQPEHDGAKHLEYTQDINDSGKHLLGVINDILDLAKIEAGQLDLREQEIDIESAIDYCLRLFSKSARANELRLERRVAEDIPALWGDERKFKQILINLLTNAVKFTPAGGKVGLEAFVDDGGGLTVKVFDTGIGIAAEDIGKAMAPFLQVDSTLGRKYDGTGLGLPLTKAFTELHDGSFELNSEVGVGTTVIVRFPAERVR